MADPQDALSQLDLQNLPPEQAAALIRQHQAALAQRQYLAGLEMQSVRPELQKAGETEYAQAGRERGTSQELGAKVLETALGKERNQIAMIQAQRELAMLGLQTKQFNELVRQHGVENVLNAYKTYKEGLTPPNSQLLAEEAQARAGAAGTEAGIGQLGPLGKTISKLLTRAPKARAAEIQQIIKESGAKTEAPMSLMEFSKQMQPGGGAIPPSALGRPTGPAAAPPAVAGSPPGQVAPAAPSTDLVTVQAPGHPPGQIHRSQLQAFKSKYPTGVVLGQ